MGVVVEYPNDMHVDNIGDIFLSKNKSEPQQTRHIDTCHHFICDYAEKGTVKIQFYRSEENMEYPLKKNLSNGPFESITSRYVHYKKDLKSSYCYLNHTESNRHT